MIGFAKAHLVMMHLNVVMLQINANIVWEFVFWEVLLSIRFSFFAFQYTNVNHDQK